MDYKKKYEEVLERAKKYHTPDSNNANLKAVIEHIFPELAESEDEKVRKEIIEVLQLTPTTTWERANTNYDRCFAWLEKQKKQNLEASRIGESPKDYESFEDGNATGWRRKEQKPAELSEGDEVVLDALIRRLEGEDIYISPHLSLECLKSLKERVLHQQQEWSEKEQEPQGLDEAAERIVINLVPTLGQKYEDGSYVQGTRDYFSRDELIGLVKAGAIWMFEKTPSEQAIAYVKASHSASEVSEFQAAMNIAAAKAFDAGEKTMSEQGYVREVLVKTYRGGVYFNYPIQENVVSELNLKEGDKVVIQIRKKEEDL